MRTVSEIEEEMEQYQEEGNLGKVMDLVDELGNMQDRLYKAIAEGDLNEALYFNSLGFDLREAACLRVAAKYGQCKLIGYLIRNGTDVHANGDEALCFAAEHGHLEAVQCLVALGADVHAQEEKPVKLATHTDKIGVVQYLVEVERALMRCLRSREAEASILIYTNGHNPIRASKNWKASYLRKTNLRQKPRYKKSTHIGAFTGVLPREHTAPLALYLKCLGDDSNFYEMNFTLPTCYQHSGQRIVLSVLVFEANKYW